MRNLLQFGVRFAYCLYLYFFYHLLVVPAFAEFSFYALLFIPLMIFGFWLVPKERRKEAIVYTFLFLFIDQALIQIFLQKIRPLTFVWVAFIGVFLFPLARAYGKIRFPAMAIALVLALVLNLLLPDRAVLALPHFIPKWSSDKLYIGQVTESFPVAVVDFDGDGRDEIITLGNRDLYPDGLRKAKFSYLLDEEPLQLFVWKWQDGALERVPQDELDVDSVLQLLPKEQLAFPYYVLRDDLVLEPLVQRQGLTESMMRFGAAPFQAMRLNLEHLDRQYKYDGAAYDQVLQSGDFKHVRLESGWLSGDYQGTSFRAASDATKIIGPIALGNGQQGLLVLGLDLQLLQMKDEQLEVTHTITREMQSSLALSRFMTHDLNRNGVEELIITFPLPVIAEPQQDGGWEILWSASERSFHIKDIGGFARGETDEILALRKSAVRASDVRYLTGYQYKERQLQQQWKIFLRNIDTAAYGDIDGDGVQELITTVYGSHKVHVWSKHAVPLTEIWAGISIMLLLALAGRRVSIARKTKKA